METIQLTKDQIIEQMMAKLEAKRAEVDLATKPSYLTGGSFRYSEGSISGATDITTARDERKLVEIAAFLAERSNAYATAAEELGCEVKFTWLGFTKEEWMTDLKTRVSVLQIAKRKAELQTLEALVNKQVSPDLRAKWEMAEIARTMAKMGM
jgi:hypothetical protein